MHKKHTEDKKLNIWWKLST